MNYFSIIEKIYDHLENDDVEKAVMACIRLSRHIQDYLHSAIFLQECYSTRKDFVKVLLDDTSNLNPETQKEIDQISRDYYLDLHTLEFSMGVTENGEEKNVLSVPIGEIESEIEQWEKHIDDLKLPQGMGELDTAAFTDRYNNQKAEIRLRIKGLQTIKSRIKSRCLNYAIKIEKQLQAQKNQNSFLNECQTLVNNYFKQHSEDVYNKLQKASHLVGSSNPEDNSLLLTQIRRSIKSAADYFYPPKNKPVICSDGEQRNLGNEQYLNRLQEFIIIEIKKSSSKELLKAEFGYLAQFTRRLNEVASKGVHSEVTMVAVGVNIVFASSGHLQKII